MPTIVIRHPDGTTEEREVTGRLTIGADDENDLVLRSKGVSQRHAQFFADGGELVLEHVGADASAEKTIVDGEPLKGVRKVKAGVRVLIGDFEVSLKPDRVSVRKLPEVKPVPKPATPMGPVLGIGAALLAVVAVGTWWVTHPAVPVIEEVPVVTGPQPCAEVESERKRAREEPSERSLAAANAVLDCDPLDKEMLERQRTITLELKGAAAAERGLKLIELDRDDQGVDALKEIPAGTKAFATSRAAALDAARRLEKTSARACLDYAKEKKWLQAEAVCERAMELKCQGTVAPNDPVLVALGRAHEHNDPRAPKWACPALPLFKPMEEAADPGKTTKEAIARKYPDPAIAAAVQLYVDGRVAEAITALQVVKEKSSKAALHSEAESLRKDLANVDSLKKIGDGQLSKHELEKAAKTYREALDLDLRVLPWSERAPSALRHAMVTELAEEARKVGEPIAKRPDWPRACAVFRLGMGFYRGNPGLNAVAAQCSTEAKALTDGARGCPDLDQALLLAIPGDGLAEAIAAQKPQFGCR